MTRLKPGDLCMSEAMPFCQSHQARVTVPIAGLDLNDFFRNVRANFRAGDTVTIVRFADASWTRVLETASLRVIEATESAVQIIIEGDVDTLAAEQSAEAICKDDLKAVWAGFAKWCVDDMAGNRLISHIDDEKVAKGMAAGEIPLPTPA
jgi:hypothetical protein